MSRLCLLFFCLLLPIEAIAAEQDPRYTPINRSDLRSAVEHTRSETDARVLIRRAGVSELAADCYHLYRDLWSKDKTSGYKCLWYGVAAMSYQDALIGPFKHPTSAEREEGSDVLQEAKQALAEAAKRLPASAIADSEDGFALWQYGGQMDAGLSLLRKAASLDPKDPKVHDYLGEVYLNPSGNAHDEPRGVAELEKASLLAPNYAHPHWRLYGYYQLTKRDKTKASAELEKYVSLLPDTVSLSQWADGQRKLISQM